MFDCAITLDYTIICTTIDDIERIVPTLIPKLQNFLMRMTIPGGPQRTIGNFEKTPAIGRQLSKLPKMADRLLVRRGDNWLRSDADSSKYQQCPSPQNRKHDEPILKLDCSSKQRCLPANRTGTIRKPRLVNGNSRANPGKLHVLPRLSCANCFANSVKTYSSDPIAGYFVFLAKPSKLLRVIFDRRLSDESVNSICQHASVDHSLGTRSSGAHTCPPSTCGTRPFFDEPESRTKSKEISANSPIRSDTFRNIVLRCFEEKIVVSTQLDVRAAYNLEQMYRGIREDR